MSTIIRIFALLEDGKPRSARQIARVLGLPTKLVTDALYRQWKRRTIARSKKKLSEVDYQHQGRAGRSRNVCHYYLFTLPEFMDARFELRPEHQEPTINKSQLVREFILEHKDQAFFSREIADALKEQGVTIFHVSPTVRKMEKKRQCYVRGYFDVEQERPFKEGFLITFLDPDKPPREALEEAFQRTEKKLQDRASASPLLQRVHRIHDAIIANALRRELTARFFLENLLDCTKDALDYAIKRCLELYPHFQKIKIFNRFVFYYDSTLIDASELAAQIQLKENWLRKVAGRWNRLGHNWEAIVGWFVDQFTRDVTFWSQEHRKKAPLDPLMPKRGMHPRRITLHLIKSVGGRKNFAEVDRVWEVAATLFTKQPTIYVLEAKWSIISRRTLDDFFEVLRWSKEFGADKSGGRVIKAGVVPIFAASSFDKLDKVTIGNEKIPLAEYARRLNIEIWTQAKFNEMLREHGVAIEVTVQRICKAAADESEVAEMLGRIWKEPAKALEILKEFELKNQELFNIEREMAEPKGKARKRKKKTTKKK